ncbi:MAG: C39 family peptidase [Lachnospiraceae bacterium]|nr:C39 family peptidase [Lachnospiraceae bacterium]MBR0434498.1 C39 family peptidase [Lachnospiraceae bacterium]
MNKRMTPRMRQAIARRFLAVIIFFLAIILIGYKAVGYISASHVPEYIREMGEKYPETKEFVRDYPKYKDKNFDMDVSKEMKERTIPLFIQWDKRWGYKDYGGKCIGTSGCGPTCVAMVACGLTGNPDINPCVVANFAVNNGFYKYGQGTSWSFMTDGARAFGIDGHSGEISADYIMSVLSEDTPIICSMKPGDFTYTGHFIVLTGIDEDGKIMVNDPNSRNNSDKHWDVDTLVKQIKALWVYGM